VLGLPFEERLAYYKSKYADKRPAAAAFPRDGGETGAGKSNSRGRGRRKAESAIDTVRTAHNMNTPSAEALKTKQERHINERPRRRHGHNAGGKAAETHKPNAQAHVSAPPKKGVLSRLLGIFKKPD
jgi:hypothetical protein